MFEKLFLVKFLATKGALVPLASYPIMLERSIRSFRHLECQNLSIMSDSIGIPNGSKKNGKMSEEQEQEWRNLIDIEEDVTSEFKISTSPN